MGKATVREESPSLGVDTEPKSSSIAGDGSKSLRSSVDLGVGGADPVVGDKTAVPHWSYVKDVWASIPQFYILIIAVNVVILLYVFGVIKPAPRSTGTRKNLARMQGA